MEEQKTETQKRPAFLTVLCILTFVGKGLSLILFLIAIIAFGTISSFLGKIPLIGEGTGVVYFILNFIICLAALYGAIQMWKLKKMGFYIYLAAIVIGYILPMFFGFYTFGIFGLILTALFPVLYGLNFKHLT